MPTDERNRSALVRAAADSWGEEVAATLSELLPAAGARPATQTDIEGVLVAMDAMDARLEGRLDGVDGRLDGVDGRLDRVDGRLDRVEGRLDRVEGRLGGVEDRLGGVEGEVRGLAERLGGVEGEVRGLAKRLGGVEGEVRGLAERIDGIVHRVNADAERRFTDLVTAQTRSLMLSLFGTVVVIAALAFGLR